METFNFPYHTLEVKYPKSSATLSLGRGYEFASKPRGPDQVEYILHFAAMFFFEDDPGQIDMVTRPEVNIGVLEEFYNEHKLYEKFIYPHPGLGDLIVRFAEPLAYKIVPGGFGRIEPFTLRLKTQP